MTDPTDAELWRRIRADDADAFGLLFARHGPQIHRYALRRTADPAVADDVTAVVFLEAWRRRRAVDLHQPSALPWLYGVAGNVIRRWHRSQARHRAALSRLEQLPPPTPTCVERQVEAAMEASAVLARIAHLPRRQQEVLLLSVGEGLSHAEIAVALDTTVGTVKSRLSRARARLGHDALGIDASLDVARDAEPIPTPLILREI
jgi:RNA polymerase sigma-70 factor (ECF subfamily)